MKRIVNLVFDRIERVLWFRHLLWTLRTKHNDIVDFTYNSETNSSVSKDVIGGDVVMWLRKHRNDYLLSENNGKATGTENSTDVNEDKS